MCVTCRRSRVLTLCRLAGQTLWRRRASGSFRKSSRISSRRCTDRSWRRLWTRTKLSHLRRHCATCCPDIVSHKRPRLRTHKTAHCLVQTNATSSAAYITIENLIARFGAIVPNGILIFVAFWWLSKLRHIVVRCCARAAQVRQGEISDTCAIVRVSNSIDWKQLPILPCTSCIRWTCIRRIRTFGHSVTRHIRDGVQQKIDRDSHKQNQQCKH